MPVQIGDYTFGVALYDQTRTLGTQDTSRYWSRFIQRHPSDVENTYTISVDSPISLSCTVVVAEARANENFSGVGLAFGGVGHRIWTAKQLPPRLSLDSRTGIISGTLDAVDSGYLEIEVRDSEGQLATAGLTFDVLPAAPTESISVPEEIHGRAGEAFRLPLSCKGVKGPVNWRIRQGSLPAGLSLLEGEIVGIPTETSTGRFTLELSDEYERILLKNIRWNIRPHIPPLQIATNSLPSCIVGWPYDLFLAARGGEGLLTWQAKGELPKRIDFTSEGRIYGTAEDTGTYLLTVEASDETGEGDSSRQLRLEILRPPSPPMSVSTKELPTAVLGQPYEAYLHAEGGYPPYDWLVTPSDGLLGLRVDGNRIVGIPTDTGTLGLTAAVADSMGDSLAPVELSLTVAENPLARMPTILTEQLPVAITGLEYTGFIAVEGGVPPLRYALVGSLPTGLALNEATGELYGTPADPGDWEMQVVVRDSLDREVRDRCAIRVIRNEHGLVTLSDLEWPEGRVGEFYRVPIPSVDGLAPLSYAVDGDLPVGLTLDSTNGVVSGTPTASGHSSFTIRIEDARAVPNQTNLICTISVAGADRSHVWKYVASVLIALNSLWVAFLALRRIAKRLRFTRGNSR